MPIKKKKKGRIELRVHNLDFFFSSLHFDGSGTDTRRREKKDPHNFDLKNDLKRKTCCPVLLKLPEPQNVVQQKSNAQQFFVLFLFWSSGANRIGCGGELS